MLQNFTLCDRLSLQEVRTVFVLETMLTLYFLAAQTEFFLNIHLSKNKLGFNLGGN